MSDERMLVLVVGATGSIGRLVVSEALESRHRVRALVRNRSRAAPLSAGAEIVVADLTRYDTLPEAVEGVDAIVFVHGTDGNETAAEQVDYGGVREVLKALGSRQVRVALMTAIGVTNRSSSYAAIAAWKRRSERLVRAGGQPYTIVRPGWFDYNDADQHRLVFLQGDKRHTGNPSDGAVSRAQIAQVLVRSLTSDSALRKTFELVAERGPAPDDLEALFDALDADVAGSLDAIRDSDNMPLNEEPARVRDDLAAVSRGRRDDRR
jgi:uncharacterized protein YbjT (DUF2867 family)